MLNNLNRTDPTWTRRITGSGVICVKNINFASRPYMYFSEQGNVDDDGTFITIFFVSFNLQSCCLMQSAVCSLQSANVIHRPRHTFTQDTHNSRKNWASVYKSTRTLLVALSLACLEISFVVKGAGAVILLFCMEYKMSVICHNVNTQKVKIARRRQAEHLSLKPL